MEGGGERGSGGRGAGAPPHWGTKRYELTETRTSGPPRGRHARKEMKKEEG